MSRIGFALSSMSVWRNKIVKSSKLALQLNTKVLNLMLTSKHSKPNKPKGNLQAFLCQKKRKRKWFSCWDPSKCPRSTRTVIFPSSFTEREKEWERKSGKTLYCQSCPETIINRVTALADPIWSKKFACVFMDYVDIKFNFQNRAE